MRQANKELMQVQLEATRVALELRMENSRVERRACDERLDLSLEANGELRADLVQRDEEREAMLEEQVRYLSNTANLSASIDEMAQALSISVVYESEAKRTMARYEEIGSALGVLLDEDAVSFGIHGGHIVIDLDGDALFGGSIRQMSKRGQETVRGVGRALAVVRGLELVVAGHTGQELPDGAEDNTPLEVSMARAGAVHDLLRSAGVADARLSVAAHGPRAPGMESTARQTRRVTLRVVPDYDYLPGARELEMLLSIESPPEPTE